MLIKLDVIVNRLIDIVEYYYEIEYMDRVLKTKDRQVETN